MAARAIGSGTISFGLVSIPVKLFSSNKPSEDISFRMIHRKCGSRLRQQYVCVKEGEVVDREDIVKGYEFSKDQYVMFEDDEIKSVAEQASKTIAIEEFIPLEMVDPVYFDKAYFLGPDKGGDRAYHLLSQSLGKASLCALAKYAARGKQYLVMIRAIEGGLVMQQLKYAHEVRTFDEVDIPEVAPIKKDELKLAMALIEQGTAKKFEHKRYVDEVRVRLEEAIAQKIEGQEITYGASDEPHAQVIDLMDALKASLGMDEKIPAKKKAAGKTRTKKKKASK